MSPLATLHPPARPLALAALLGLVLGLAPPAAAGHPERIETCAGGKLETAAAFCSEVFTAFSTRDRFWRWRAYTLDRAEQELEEWFVELDDIHLSTGGRCDEATGGAADVSALVQTEAEALAGEIRNATPDGLRHFPRWLRRWLDHARARGQLGAAAALCAGLLDAEADHLHDRFEDRLREQLHEDRDASAWRFARRWRFWTWLLGDRGGLDGAAVADRVDGLARAVRESITISPLVSSEWTMVEPPAVVTYDGRDYTPTCWDGEPWVFFVKRGSVNNVVMYYQGGGACWSSFTCGGLPGVVSPTFKRSTGPGDNPANFSSGFADASNPDNPFRDWHQVFVPYCTGDVHWGDAVVDYDLLGNPLTVRHKGFHNAQVAEQFAREHFVHPDQVFVTGSSAGAYGAIVNSLYLQERVYPSADFAVVGDAGNGVITQDFLVNDLSNWGIQDNLPPWMPGLNVPLTQLRASDLYIEAARTYPQNRFATYTTAYDGGQGGQTGFFQVMRVGLNILDWVRWWDSSCAWNEEMLALNAEASAASGANFRSYVGTGSAHTMWGRNKVYDDTTGNVPTIRDWLVAMLDDGPGWTDVIADDFGLLLDGDPRPNPNSPINPPPYEPFDLDAGRIVCD